MVIDQFFEVYFLGNLIEIRARTVNTDASLTLTGHNFW